MTIIIKFFEVAVLFSTVVRRQNAQDTQDFILIPVGLQNVVKTSWLAVSQESLELQIIQMPLPSQKQLKIDSYASNEQGNVFIFFYKKIYRYIFLYIDALFKCM